MIRSLSRRPFVRVLLAGGLVSLCCGCHVFSNLGTGTHMDATHEHPHDPDAKRVREMVMDVTTDAEGNVAEVHFERSSGKEGLDGFTAQTVRNTWPKQPSTRSVVSVKYSGEKGLFEPKLLSSTPLAAPAG